MHYYYRLKNTRYALVATDRGLVLRKAGVQGPRVGDTKIENGVTYRFNQNFRWERVENAAAPGQMSLFGGLPTVQDQPQAQPPVKPTVQDQTPMPAAQAPAPPDSYADMVHSAMGAHRAQMDALVAAHKGRIDNMTLAQLYDHDTDNEYDDYHADSVNGLDAQIKGSVDSSHHQQIDKHFDNAYSKHKDLGYNSHLKELRKHHDKRITFVEKQVDKVKDKHKNGFEAFVDRAIRTDPSSLQEWNAVKSSINERFEEVRDAATKEVSALDGGVNGTDDLVVDLADIRDNALEYYSDEDFDEGESEDENEEMSPLEINDQHHDRFIDLAMQAEAELPPDQARDAISKHYADLLERGKAAISAVSGTQKDLDDFEETLKGAYDDWFDEDSN